MLGSTTTAGALSVAGCAHTEGEDTAATATSPAPKGPPATAGPDGTPANTVVRPPDGADLVKVIKDAPEPPTIRLQPGAKYVISEPLPYPGNGAAIIGPGGAHGPENLADPHIVYEGPTGDGTAAVKWDSKNPISGVLLKNLHIDAGGADHGFKGFYLTNRSRLSNVWIKETASHAFDLQKVWYADMIRCVARVNIGGDGLHVQRLCNDLFVDRFQVNKIEGAGIRGQGYMKLQINRPVIEKTVEEGIRFEDTSGQVAIYEPYFEQCGLPSLDAYDPEPGTAAVRVNAGATNIMGGYWHQNAGDPHVHLGSGVRGQLTGGEYAAGGGSYVPKHHILNESSQFAIYWPETINDTKEEIIRSDGYVQATGDGSITARNTPQDLSGTSGLYDGEQLVDDGSNTFRRGTICTWDRTNEQWVPSDGGTPFA